MQRPWLFPLLAAAMVISWSGGFIGIRFATEGAAVETMLFWRSLASGLILLPFALRGPAIGARAALAQGLLSFLGMFLYLGGFSWAIALRVPTGLVALMADLVPLAIAALAWPMLGQRWTGRQALGTLIGIAGVALTTAPALRLGHAPLYAYALPVLGMVTFGLATVLQKRSPGLGIVQRLCLQCLWAALFFSPFAALGGGLVPPMTFVALGGIAWLVLVATLASWGIYYLCLRLYPPNRVAALIYLSQPLTMVWAHLVFAEPLTLGMIAGLVVTLGGVALVSGQETA
ncbi:DMT family transporter [Stagnihabitans tardus]|uniref:EamA family transporter n=1 Tax=Stagnihabitans tardus TaxID=2699202 RepID=A0AAE4YDX9_9RHOB|nr:DMT family transporter [Stagnihabitans tardus]NBZ89558.1 EamA family transporter [Stagnihabitans tardus]